MGIKIEGLDKLFKKLNAAAATQTLVKPMERGVNRLLRRMQEVAPPLSPRQGPARAGASKKAVARFRKPYKRTNTYVRRWTPKVTASGNGVQGRVGNNVAYGPYVGSEQWQARMHRGRWNTDKKVIEQEAPGILADFQQVIDKALAE